MDDRSPYYKPYMHAPTSPYQAYDDMYGRGNLSPQPAPWQSTASFQATPMSSSYDLSGDDRGLLSARSPGRWQHTPPLHLAPSESTLTLAGPPAHRLRATKKQRHRGPWIVAAICLLITVAAAAIIVIIIRRHSSAAASSIPSSTNGTGSTGGGPGNVLIAGGDGSTVVTENGTTFTYKNPYGGSWYFDPANPFIGGKANSWTPAHNETWDWTANRINGVNLGGWLVLEPFITPAIFQKYAANHTMDEWSLHTVMAQDTSPGGGIGQLEDHYKTFITEEDFAQIAGAGLNWVRLPLPYWAIEKWDPEPFVEKVAWTYFLKAIGWARKYGLRINVDLHTIPGSQNGWNHSGKSGKINFLRSVMGIANAQRTLSYIRVIAQFISQPQYASVVPIFGVINEPTLIGNDILSDFYLQVYNTVRGVSGIGKGPVISIFDEHLDGVTWTTFLPGADRVARDVHPYFAFGPPANNTPANYGGAPCHFSAPINQTWAKAGIVAAGEFSVAINDCGLYVEQGATPKFETQFGPNACDPWDDYASWSPDTIAAFRKFFSTQADALVNWFFWTWKVAPSALSGKIEAPMWSYSLGLQEGWIPADLSETHGLCTMPETDPRPTALPPVSSAVQTAGLVWPPVTLADERVAAVLPTYTPTGTLVTLPVPTFTDPAHPGQTLDAGTGWFNAHDGGDAGMYVPIRGCSYPDPWNAVGVPVPTACVSA